MGPRRKGRPLRSPPGARRVPLGVRPAAQLPGASGSRGTALASQDGLPGADLSSPLVLEKGSAILSLLRGQEARARCAGKHAVNLRPEKAGCPASGLTGGEFSRRLASGPQGATSRELGFRNQLGLGSCFPSGIGPAWGWGCVSKQLPWDWLGECPSLFAHTPWPFWLTLQPPLLSNLQSQVLSFHGFCLPQPQGPQSQA